MMGKVLVPEDASVIAIEDHADTLFVLQGVLSKYLRCRFAIGRPSGAEFFRYLEANEDLQPDLILLDIQLPYEDGYSVLKNIRNHPRLRETRVVALTANVMAKDVEKIRSAGFDGLIGKPIIIAKLTDQVRRVLAGEFVWEPA